MTTEELRAKAFKAWQAYRKEPDKKRKEECQKAFKAAREEFLAAKNSENKQAAGSDKTE